MNSDHFGTTITANKLLSLVKKCTKHARTVLRLPRGDHTISPTRAALRNDHRDEKVRVHECLAQLLEFIVYLMMTVNFCTAPRVPGLFGPLETP